MVSASAANAADAQKPSPLKSGLEFTGPDVRKLQADGLADPRVDPTIASDALGSMVARLAELWMTQQGYRQYDFDEAVDQLTLLWANAIGINTEEFAG